MTALQKYSEIIDRYRNGDFGDDHLTIHELLAKAGEENLLNEMTTEEFDILIDRSTGFMKQLFLDIKNKKQ